MPSTSPNPSDDARRPSLSFWFDPASTYAYLSAMRIEDLAAAAQVRVVVKPFLLGPIFQSQGWDTSPFNIYPAKGRYMVRDVERVAKSRGVTFAMPKTFPAHSVAAARAVIVADENGRGLAMACALFDAQFARGQDISDPATLSACARRVGLSSDDVLDAIAMDRIKRLLRTQTDAAAAAGIFGAPTFVTDDGEVFWGDDRLEMAFTWALTCARRPSEPETL
ncbi:MAG: 2-hydroxychromene-2-carboxylate isomerase [Pseudomonadota bacterium]